MFTETCWMGRGSGGTSAAESAPVLGSFRWLREAGWVGEVQEQAAF